MFERDFLTRCKNFPDIKNIISAITHAGDCENLCAPLRYPLRAFARKLKGTDNDEYKNDKKNPRAYNQELDWVFEKECGL